MGRFKMKSPYKWDPISIHEVPFDDPRLMGKANKNGTIIMNKDQARDPEMREKIKIHEKQHLNDMLVEKNKDGSPKLDYDADSVSWKGTEYRREDFDEGNKNLPWEVPAYKATKDIDFTGKFKNSPSMIGGKGGRNDEDFVSMGESFGPSKRGFMDKPRGKSNPFRYMEDQGLLDHGMIDAGNAAPNSFSNPDRIEPAPPVDWSETIDKATDLGKDVMKKKSQMGEGEELKEDELQAPGMYGPAQIDDIAKNPGSQQTADDLAEKNLQSAEWFYDEETGKEKRIGTGTSERPAEQEAIPEASGGGRTTDVDEYITKLKSRFPNATRDQLVDGGYLSSSWTGTWQDPEKKEPETFTATREEYRDIPTTTTTTTEDDDDGGGDTGITTGENTFEETKNKNKKKWNISFRRKKKGKSNQQQLFSCDANTGECKTPGNVDETIVKSKKGGGRSSYRKTKRKSNKAKRKYRRKGGLY